jgi:hypothetical protein
LLYVVGFHKLEIGPALAVKDSITHETVRRVLKKRTQTLAAKRMRGSAEREWQLCGANGNGAGCIQARSVSTISGGMHGRIPKTTHCRDEDSDFGVTVKPRKA